MTDRPIIFSAPMVRALLDGRKTQTRRALKPQPTEQPAANCHPAHKPRHPAPYLDAYCGEPRTYQNPRGQGRDWHWWQVDDRCGPVACRVPYAPGDRLWVRETFIGPYAYEVNEYPPRDWGNKPIWFPADGPVPEKHAGQFWHRARPSIHMPRWASRLTLTVTDVRVQRLQDISEADAIAEGGDPVQARMYPELGTCRHWFQDLWNSLHGPGAWDANPWVVALTFTVQRGNIDQLPGVAE